MTKKSDPNLNDIQKIWENSSRISVLETIFKDMKDDLHEIKTNHLVHLAGDIQSIKESLTKLKIDFGWIIAIATFISTILVNVAMKFFFK